MNRAQRRHGGFGGVILRGGPMNGGIVAPNAPALAPDWWWQWPMWMRRKGQLTPGRYVMDASAGLPTAVWQDVEGPALRPWRPSPWLRFLRWMAGIRGWRDLVRPLGLLTLVVLVVLAAFDASQYGGLIGLTIGDLFLRLLADDRGFAADVEKKASKAGDKAGKTMGQRMSQGIQRGMTVLGGIVGTGIASGIEQFGKFDDQMREVFAIMPGISQAAMDSMKSDVKGVATEYGILTDELIPALGTAIGSGIPEDNVMDFLRVAAKAAKAGAADANTSVTALAASINAFQIPVENADQVANSFFNAIDKGVTTFPELAGSISLVAPQAAALGLSLEDVLAGVTAMTLQGTPTAQAMTQVNASLVALQRTTPEMRKALEALGFETGQAALDALGFQGTMEALRAEADRQGVPLIKLTGRMEGASAILQLTGQNAERANEILGTFGQTAGKVDAAFETMEGGIGGASRRLAAQMEVIAIDVGEKFAAIGPVLLALNQGGQLFGVSGAKIVGGIAGAFTGKIIPGLAGAIRKAFAGNAIASAIGDGLGSAIGKVKGSSAITKATSGLGSFLGSKLGKAAAVAFAAIAVVEVINTYNDIKGQLGEQSEQIGEDIANQIKRGSVEELKASRAAVQKGLDDLNSVWDAGLFTTDTRRSLEAQLTALDQAIASAASGTAPTVAGALASGEGTVDAAAEDLVDGIPGAVEDAGEDAKEKASEVVGGIADVITGRRTGIEAAIEKMKEAIDEGLTEAQEIARFRRIGSQIIDDLNSDIPEVRARAMEVATMVDEGLESLGEKPFDWGERVPADVLRGILAAEGRAEDGGELAADAVERGLSTVDGKPAGQQAGDELIDGLNTKGSAIEIAAKNAAKRLLAGFTTYLQTNAGRREKEGGPAPTRNPSTATSRTGGLRAFASGGLMSAGEVGLVGERGPELFMPKASGQIVPNDILRAMAAGTVINGQYNLSVNGVQKEVAMTRDGFIGALDDLTAFGEGRVGGG